MKTKLIAIMIILSMTTIIADNPIDLTLSQGKNSFLIEEYFESRYASELMLEYPEIQSISISEYGNSFGYINVMGGIGSNILIESNREYEIYTEKNITINLKN